MKKLRVKRKRKRKNWSTPTKRNLFSVSNFYADEVQVEGDCESSSMDYEAPDGSADVSDLINDTDEKSVILVPG